MDAQQGAQPPADEVQVSVKFVTKLGAEFRVPETPIVSTRSACLLGCAMHAPRMPVADAAATCACFYCRPFQATSRAMGFLRS